MVETRANLVAGTWVADGGDGYRDDINPSDVDDVIAKIPAMAAEQAASAVRAAVDSARGWRETSSVIRGEILRKAGSLLRERSAEIADVLRREAGKPRRDALGEVIKSAEFLEYYGGLGRSPVGEVLPDARPGVVAQTRYEPLGVVVAITPWNDPLLTPARKLGPALVTGNTIVLKPASYTPIVSQELARALSDAGLPAGVVNTVTGNSDIVGPVLVDNPDVDAVTFTGSTAVGKDLRQRLAGSAVRLQTEMGGKNAVLVMPDADLAAAATTIVAAAFGGVGQRCTAASRLIVHEDVYDELLDAVFAVMANIHIGPTSEEATTHGPVISQTQLSTVLSAIGRARDEGGRILRGGDHLIDSPLDQGFFVDPAVIEVRPDTGLWRDEVFGPVLAVTKVTSLDAAIDIVNDSPYGLSAGIFTTDLAASHVFAERVNTGQVAVNLPTSGWDAHLPFGGFKDSGSLFKEQGAEGLRFYTRVKTVAMRVV